MMIDLLLHDDDPHVFEIMYVSATHITRIEHLPAGSGCFVFLESNERYQSEQTAKEVAAKVNEARDSGLS